MVCQDNESLAASDLERWIDSKMVGGGIHWCSLGESRYYWKVISLDGWSLSS